MTPLPPLPIFCTNCGNGEMKNIRFRISGKIYLKIFASQYSNSKNVAKEYDRFRAKTLVATAV